MGSGDASAIMDAAGTYVPTSQNNQKTSPTGNANNTRVADDDSVGSAGNMPI